MSDFYSDLQKVAASVLAEFKQGVVHYVSVTPGNGPADNPGEPATVSYPLNVAARGVSAQYVNGTEILSSDLQLTMSADGVEPKLTGFIDVDGVQYKIVKVMKVPPAGTPVVFIVFFRR